MNELERIWNEKCDRSIAQIEIRRKFVENIPNLTVWKVKPIYVTPRNDIRLGVNYSAEAFKGVREKMLQAGWWLYKEQNINEGAIFPWQKYKRGRKKDSEGYEVGGLVLEIVFFETRLWERQYTPLSDVQLQMIRDWIPYAYI